MKTLLAFIFSVVMLFVNAQKNSITPPTQKLMHCSFSMLTGGTVIIKAQLDSFTDTLNFIFDTGSGGISLDSATVDDLQLTRTKTNKSIRGIAGIRTVDFTNNHRLKLNGLAVDSLDFHINNYDILSSAFGVKIDGVIGYSFLKKYIFKVNYDNYTIEVYQPSAIKYPRGGHLLNPDLLQLPIIDAQILDDSKSNEKFIFDTGAGLNMLLSEEYVKDSSVLNKKRKRFATQAEGLGGKKLMSATVVKKVMLGPFMFRWVPVYIFSDDYNATGYPKVGGVIGNDILRRFNLIINYPNSEIFITPNSHFFDDFDYSYTGLSFYQINGEVRVEDIVEGSPADKAGFKQDDIIVAIENNFTQNLQTYKQLLQNAGSTVKVVVKRQADIVSINLKIMHLMH
jgi:hypothetical protein